MEGFRNINKLEAVGKVSPRVGKELEGEIGPRFWFTIKPECDVTRNVTLNIFVS